MPTISRHERIIRERIDTLSERIAEYDARIVEEKRGRKRLADERFALQTVLDAADREKAAAAEGKPAD